MPLRSWKMYGFILGFHRRVWWPKWTPASSRARMETTDMENLSAISGPPSLAVPFRDTSMPAVLAGKLCRARGPNPPILPRPARWFHPQPPRPRLRAAQVTARPVAEDQALAETAVDLERLPGGEPFIEGAFRVPLVVP